MYGSDSVHGPFFIHKYKPAFERSQEMILFFTILATMFIAEMGDKTQLMMIAMSSRYKLRDILIGAGAAILVLNGLAVALGALISQLIPTWLIRMVAGLAFFYFAWSTVNRISEEDGEEEAKPSGFPPILAVFGTFFLAELGDKTQLTAITFAANEGANSALSKAIMIWLACSIGLFLADMIGMLAGQLIKKKLPDSFLDILAFVIFAIFGFTTLAEGLGFLAAGAIPWLIAAGVSLLFAVLCFLTWRHNRAKDRAQT